MERHGLVEPATSDRRDASRGGISGLVRLKDHVELVYERSAYLHAGDNHGLGHLLQLETEWTRLGRST